MNFIRASASEVTFMVAGDADIVIDGYLDDWEDKPYTQVSWSDWAVHKAALFMDDEYLYIRISMSENYVFNSTAIFLYINGKICNTAIYPIDSEHSSDFTQVLTGISDIKLVHQENSKLILGYGKLNRHNPDGKGDFCEMAIPLTVFYELPSLDLGSTPIQTITASYPNLGGQTITCAGTSTAPYVVVAVGFVSVTAFLYLKKRKNELC